MIDRETSCIFAVHELDLMNDWMNPFQKGLKSIGYSPMINIPSLLHDHNESVATLIIVLLIARKTSSKKVVPIVKHG